MLTLVLDTLPSDRPTNNVVTRILVLLDCVVGSVLTPFFGESSAFARQTDARNGLSRETEQKTNFLFLAEFGKHRCTTPRPRTRGRATRHSVVGRR